MIDDWMIGGNPDTFDPIDMHKLLELVDSELRAIVRDQLFW